jgi:transposase
MRPPMPLPEGSVEQLQGALRGAQTKAEFQRVQCVWLRAALGLNANQVAVAVGWAPTSVRRLHSQYLRDGEAALQGRGRGGRRRENLSAEQERHLLQGFLARAAAGGLLETSRVKAAYEAAVGHCVPKSTVYRLLSRHGWRKVAPRPRHPKGDPDERQAFKKTVRDGA